MSAYIHYIGSYLLKYPQKLIDQKDRIETILSKLIEIEHYELFYRFLYQLVKVSDIDSLYKSGYFKVIIQGSSIIATKNVTARKFSLIFLLRMMLKYDAKTTANYVNL